MVRPVLINVLCPFSCALRNATSALSGISCVISLKIVPSISKNNADITSSILYEKTDIVYYN